MVIGDHQHFNGYTLFLCKKHCIELHELDEDFKLEFLKEMSITAHAVYNAFKPDKLNYELLGNGDTHLHWHIFPRVNGDLPQKGPVWLMPRIKRFEPAWFLSVCRSILLRCPARGIHKVFRRLCTLQYTTANK